MLSQKVSQPRGLECTEELEVQSFSSIDLDFKSNCNNNNNNNNNNITKQKCTWLRGCHGNIESKYLTLNRITSLHEKVLILVTKQLVT